LHVVASLVAETIPKLTLFVIEKVKVSGVYCARIVRKGVKVKIAANSLFFSFAESLFLKLQAFGPNRMEKARPCGAIRFLSGFEIIII